MEHSFAAVEDKPAGNLAVEDKVGKVVGMELFVVVVVEVDKDIVDNF